MKAQIILSEIEGIYCSTFACTNPVKWKVGDPDGPIFHFICEECAKNIVETSPFKEKKEEVEVAAEESEDLPFVEEEEEKPKRRRKKVDEAE